MSPAFALVLLLARLASAEDTDEKCPTAVTLSGLGGDLDGDFVNGGYFYRRFDGRELLLQRFVNVSDDHWRSPEDAKKNLGQWVIINSANSNPQCGYGWGQGSCETYAVCEEGCPILPGHDDLGNFDAAIWPKGSFTTKWTVLGAAGAAARTVVNTVSVTGSCCKRKAQKCDDCDAQGICSGLWNAYDCPATGTHAKLHPLAKECCERRHPPPLEIPVCSCKGSEFECDHSADAGGEQAEQAEQVTV